MSKINNLISLQLYSFYKTGGKALNFVQPDSIDQFVSLYKQHASEMPWILGAGANTIFGDSNIKTPIFSTEKLNKLRVEDQIITAEAGVTLNQLITTSIKHDLAGLESLSGIPGSVGGATWMNAGAYGSEISDFITSVKVLVDGEVKVLDKQQCNFSYRSAINLKEVIVLEVTWELPKGNEIQLTEKRLEILKSRSEKQPLEYPSCGSVFKRPKGDYASRLIDAAGLKGFQIGGAQVSTKHAGFIINRDQATTADILDLIKHCQKVVYEKFQIKLELEQQVLLK